MSEHLETAKKLLAQGDYTCVLCHGDSVYTSTQRGVRPLLDWLHTPGLNVSGFSAADRVVGRATAFLYVLLGVREVYARTMSRPAMAVFQEFGIDAQASKIVDGIINRQGNGPCPFEAAVLGITQPAEALAAIDAKMATMLAASQGRL